MTLVPALCTEYFGENNLKQTILVTDFKSNLSLHCSRFLVRHQVSFFDIFRHFSLIAISGQTLGLIFRHFSLIAISGQTLLGLIFRHFSLIEIFRSYFSAFVTDCYFRLDIRPYFSTFLRPLSRRLHHKDQCSSSEREREGIERTHSSNSFFLSLPFSSALALSRQPPTYFLSPSLFLSLSFSLPPQAAHHDLSLDIPQLVYSMTKYC